MMVILKGPIDNNPALVKINGLSPNGWIAIIWTIADPIHWRIYAAPGGDEFTFYVTQFSET